MVRLLGRAGDNPNLRRRLPKISGCGKLRLNTRLHRHPWIRISPDS
jgi:hypothetical protein